MAKNRSKSVRPLVGILMGSASDMPVLKEAGSFLEECGIPYEMQVLSAHRTPEETARYARNAEKNGVKVLIAAAGGAAHLPGVVAALTHLPVIGVPIKAKSLDGLDSLLSIAQMPAGVPVATMAINGARNAAIFAARILALGSAALRQRVERHREKMRRDVLERAKEVNVRSGG